MGYRKPLKKDLLINDRSKGYENEIIKNKGLKSEAPIYLYGVIKP